jgi:hypothetical protein
VKRQDIFDNMGGVLSHPYFKEISPDLLYTPQIKVPDSLVAKKQYRRVHPSIYRFNSMADTPVGNRTRTEADKKQEILESF